MCLQTVLSAGKQSRATHNSLCLPFSDWMKMWRDIFKPITLLFKATCEDRITHRSNLLALSPLSAFQMLNVMQQTQHKTASTKMKQVYHVTNNK